ncbi:hypothetical protein H072_3045 [Dactylellina haptotyla CBS 200.50]|uniref:Uncharacterized protein n=1 Tax=Dactylellina haptotyla (strain CBS 200.50) TaxID=1284197 RepID=S8C5H2_DACHA|nr:hypothetical protein H072_3045 [Dactylellina haptotyla CBS 200.50]
MLPYYITLLLLIPNGLPALIKSPERPTSTETALNHKETPTTPQNHDLLPEAVSANIEEYHHDELQNRVFINPTLFYSENAILECLKVPAIMRLAGPWAEFPPRGRLSARRPEFGDMPLNIADSRARAWRRICLNCLCDPGTGRVVLNPDGRDRGYIYAGYECRHEGTPERCEAWFGCECEWQMHQPPKFPGVKVSDYQDALNGIPDLIKSKNPSYVWEKYGLSWEKDLGDAAADATADATSNFEFSTNRRLVPGTREPYYVEGPSKGKTWDWIFNSYPLTKAGGGSGSRTAALKREVSKEAVEPNPANEEKPTT